MGSKNRKMNPLIRITCSILIFSYAYTYQCTMDRSHLMIYVFQNGYFIENIIHRDERLFLLLRSVSDGAKGSFWR